MQSASGVRIDVPELLTAVYVATRDKRTQAALAMTSRAWAAVSRGCRTVSVQFDLGPPRPYLAGLRGRLEAPSSDLAGLPRWLLAQQQCSITNLELRLADEGPIATSWQQGSSRLRNPAVRGTIQAQAREALAVLAGCLEELQLYTGIDASWLPPLPFLTNLALLFSRRRLRRGDPGEEVLLAWLAEPQLLPRLRHLEICTSIWPPGAEWPLFEDAVPTLGASLPAGVTQLELGGMVTGLDSPGVLSQLHSLQWELNSQAYCNLASNITWRWTVPALAWEAICMATRLTNLSLWGPATGDGDEPFFFGCLSEATQLRSLEIGGFGPGHGGEDSSFVSAGCIPDPDRRHFLIHGLFGPALAALSRLTSLSLIWLGLSEAPGAPGGGLALLPALSELDVRGGIDMRALPFGPYQTSLRRLTVDGTVVAAALADVPGHALWGMSQLACLTVQCAEDALPDIEDETEEQWQGRIDAAERRVRELLPSLNQINFIVS